MVFRHGAIAVGASPETVTTMGSLGAAFGEIAYIADAIQDRKKDAEKGEFNALAATRISSSGAKRLLRLKQGEMLAHLAALPIDESQKRNYAGRLHKNFEPLAFMRRRPDRVIIVQERRPGFCSNCCDAICCCEAINCCDCLGSGCCECMGGGCCILS